MNDEMNQNYWLEGMTFCSSVLLKGAGTESQSQINSLRKSHQYTHR